jgi:hypothetical protein
MRGNSKHVTLAAIKFQSDTVETYATAFLAVGLTDKDARVAAALRLTDARTDLAALVAKWLDEQGVKE